MIEIRSFRATCCLFKSAKACISAMELKSKFPPLTMTPIFSELILSLYANNAASAVAPAPSTNDLVLSKGISC